jgi:DHA1 family tetracycline resistance protein-like MFS transporter
MSRTALDDQQGELQGAVTSINAVATVLAPMMVTQTFWFFTQETTPLYLPGAPFLLSAVLTIGCIFVFMQTPRPIRAAAE